MTSTTSIFASPAADVTLDRVRDLVRQNLPESLTLEYKEDFTPRLVTSVAAMANSYGGVILVGVTDSPAEDRLVGVQEPTVTQVVNACHEKLEPPWEPEIIPVPLKDDRLVLVIRVDPARAPRPLFIDNKAPIRLQGRNATADRSRLAQLFADAATSPASTGWRIKPPQLPQGADGSASVDFLLHSGLILPLGERAIYRPISDGSVNSLATALNDSQLATQLAGWAGRVGIQSLNQFRRYGFNRSRRARLVWQAVIEGPVPYPIESTAVVNLPDSYGASGTLEFALTITTGLGLIPAGQAFHFGRQPWRLSLADLYESIDGMLITLTSNEVVAALADLADTDPVLVPQPANLYFLTGREVSELVVLDDLAPVPEAGPSRGASLLADPSFDLRSAAERHSQIDNWMVQLVLDAGLTGAEKFLTRYHNAYG